MERNLKESELAQLHKMKIKKTRYQLLKTLLLFSVYQKKQEALKKNILDGLVIVLTKFAKINFWDFKGRVLSSSYGAYCKAFNKLGRASLKHTFDFFRRSLAGVAASKLRFKRLALKGLNSKRLLLARIHFDRLRAYNYTYAVNDKYFKNYVA